MRCIGTTGKPTVGVVAVDPVMLFCIGQQNLYALPVVISKP
jgi:hypothetical protein